MIQDYPDTDLFKKQMRESLQREVKNSRAIKIPKHENVYAIGEQDEMVYFIESGQVKLLMLSSEGRECLLAIHAPGDVFGELCLSGIAGRLETATAMEDTRLKKVPCAKFLGRLATDSLLEGFVKYLAVRVADQQERRRDAQRRFEATSAAASSSTVFESVSDMGWRYFFQAR